MESKRIAVLAGVIGVISAVIKIVPGILLGSLFEQGLPGWLPTFGTIGGTATLYNYGIDVIGALLMVVLAIGFGYSVSRQLDLSNEYRQFCGAVVAGTTVPFIVLWIVGFGAFILGNFSAFTVLVTTVIVLRLFATVSLPVIVSVFAGAAFGHFSRGESSPPEPDEMNTDAISTTS
ncbi:hypothetical protein C448_14078 [Halococcus morrhuae DSM 1307]|uniref:Uncharacterized protein n=1 Tax=Halococcus morrhuae DSM 1307 TaxID=931277 RepID=M0M2P1_HALMO|nr:hypothetical protein [Halococcus morrhuae]EMA40062.1 hypothetical protein C448_14078 [Halococcus morrhuae DSM 1307]